MKIWKFPLDITDIQYVELPFGANVLTAQFQNGELNLWAECDEYADTCSVPVLVIGTGNEMPEYVDMERYRYLTTVQQHGGILVWHIYVQK